MGKRATTAAAMAIALAATMATAAPSSGSEGGDANENGLDEIAIGIPNKAVGGDTAAGQVVLIKDSGSSAAAWTSDTPGVVGASEPLDQFGVSTAWGDFNGDGFDDLAIGAAGETVGALSDAGAVTILRGSATGITATGSRELTEDTAGIAGVAEADDRWGQSLATGDINGDGRDDLVVSAYKQDADGVEQAGAITVILGSATGLTGTGSIQLTQASPGVPSTALSYEQWGYAGIAVGDVDGDGHDDVAVASPYETVGDATNAGQVTLLRGSAAGLTTAKVQIVNEDSPGVVGTAETGDFWSSASVGLGDINGDGRADLVVGASGEDVAGKVNAGAVSIIRGSATGLTGTGSRQYHSDSSGVVGAAEAGDQLGYGKPAIGDFNGDGIDDVAVPIPYEKVGDDVSAGALLMLRGSASGIVATGSRELTADSAGVAGAAEPYEYLGYNGLSSVKRRAGAYDDLLVTVAWEDVGAIQTAGAVILLRGSSTGLTGTGSVQITEDTAGIPGDPTAGSYFGWSAT